ncbi:hypothetical protein V2J09_022751, partial [Rumex salicifolius]
WCELAGASPPYKVSTFSAPLHIIAFHYILIFNVQEVLTHNQVGIEAGGPERMKLHGNVMSTATMRATACLHEKEIDFEFVNVDMRSGAHKHPSFLSLNPFGQVPAFEDGDLQLFESRAITQYLAHEHKHKGTDLVCGNGKTMALISVWSEVESKQFDPVTSKLVWELLVKKMLGMETDEAVVAESEAKLAAVLDVYEARLSKSKYLACDCFTLADLHHLPNIHVLMSTPVKKLFDQRPHFAAWSADILARPAWAKVVAAAEP